MRLAQRKLASSLVVDEGWYAIEQIAFFVNECLISVQLGTALIRAGFLAMGPATLASVSAEVVDKAGCDSWLDSCSDGNPFRLKSRQPWCLSLTSVWLGLKLAVCQWFPFASICLQRLRFISGFRFYWGLDLKTLASSLLPKEFSAELYWKKENMTYRALPGQSTQRRHRHRRTHTHVQHVLADGGANRVGIVWQSLRALSHVIFRSTKKKTEEEKTKK